MLTEDLFLKPPYNRFKEFIAQESDRFCLLCSILDEHKIPHRILDIEGKRHIAVNASDDLSGGLLFTAHYDRTPDSPGANDNGAAVFQLLELALQTSKAIIFTDGEELAKGESLRLQGAYSLGLFLKKSGINARIFTFDACGSGDTLIISTAADHLLKNETGSGADALRHKVETLRRSALEAARIAHLENVLLLPTPFSEDAGFFLAGLAAQTITVLPRSEATAAATLARSGKADILTAAGPADPRLIPETWRSLNGPGDSPLRLTPSHWKKVSAFAGALA
jgi:hypothetical protein